MVDDRQFGEQILTAMADMGSEEAIKTMAKLMLAFSANAGCDVDIKSEMGVVTISPSEVIMPTKITAGGAKA